MRSGRKFVLLGGAFVTSWPDVDSGNPNLATGLPCLPLNTPWQTTPLPLVLSSACCAASEEQNGCVMRGPLSKHTVVGRVSLALSTTPPHLSLGPVRAASLNNTSTVQPLSARYPVPGLRYVVHSRAQPWKFHHNSISESVGSCIGSRRSFSSSESSKNKPLCHFLKWFFIVCLFLG